MISIFQVVKVRSGYRKDTAWACALTRTKTGFDFHGYNCALDKDFPAFITVINLTNPNNYNLWDTAAAQRIHRVSAVDGDVVKILTPNERYLVYVYNGEAVTIFFGNTEVEFPSQEEINYRISLIPESIGFLKVEHYMREIFSKFSKLPTHFDKLVNLVHERMIRDNLEYTLPNVSNSFISVVDDAAASIR